MVLRKIIWLPVLQTDHRECWRLWIQSVALSVLVQSCSALSNQKEKWRLSFIYHNQTIYRGLSRPKLSCQLPRFSWLLSLFVFISSNPRLWKKIKIFPVYLRTRPRGCFGSCPLAFNQHDSKAMYCSPEPKGACQYSLRDIIRLHCCKTHRT